MLTIKPIGVGCQLECLYCFEGQARKGGFQARYDLLLLEERLRQHVRRGNNMVGLHGGEPTLLPMDDFEAILKLIFERTGKSYIQTNGQRLTDQHKELFRRYKTHVGISIDGPWPYNRLRWAGSEEATRAYTEKLIADIHEMLQEGIPVGVITVLHKVNACPDAYDDMRRFYEGLIDRGLDNLRFNPAFITYPAAAGYQLSEWEVADFYRAMYPIAWRGKTVVQPYVDVRARLLIKYGKPEAKRSVSSCSITCAWKNCDPYATQGEHILYGDGSEANCARLLEVDGNSWERSPVVSFHRVKMLAQVPWYAGGCMSCPWFDLCSGQCVAEAIDGHFMNRSRFCGAWYALFKMIHDDLYAQGLLETKVEHPDSPLELDLWKPCHPCERKKQGDFERALAYS